MVREEGSFGTHFLFFFEEESYFGRSTGWRRYPWRTRRCRIRDTPTPAATASRNAGERNSQFFEFLNLLACRDSEK